MGLYRDNGKEYWGYIGIMEKKMDTTISIFGLYRDNGKEMETTIHVLGLYGDTGKEYANYY